MLAPSTQQDGIAAIPCNDDDNDDKEVEEATKVSDGASLYSAAATQQTQSPTEIDPVCAWGGDTRLCDFCNVKRTRQANYCYKRSLELWVLL